MAPARCAAHAGSAVWVRRAAGAPQGRAVAGEWASAVVVAVDDASGAVAARTGDGAEATYSAADVMLRGSDEGVQDLVRLGHLNEPSVLDALARRYAGGEIYTRAGSGIVIAINPFAPMPALYGASAMDAYRKEGAAEGGGGGRGGGGLAPHIFGMASRAYWKMMREGKGQALLVTGESGAGKTETSKLLMKYLAYLGGYKAAAGSESDDSTRPRVEQRVLESNPLLEAFGNAKTVRNDNSSRFGKYIELHFCAAGSISGGRVHTYLLERSRLVAPSKGERNYHIFYQMLAGATKEERARWQLSGSAADHRLTAAAGCLSLPGVDDAAHFGVTRHAMRAVGLTADDQEQLFRLLSSLLHLCDADFGPCPKGGEGCTLAPSSAASLGAAAELLGCDAAALAKAVTTRTRVTPDGPIVSPLGAKAAAETRDALVKVVYARLFDWLVARINAAIGEDPRRASTIGLLDIYGFESFAFNDLEQFCINLANEKLQQHFNHHVFKQEQAEYEREGIDWSYIEFVDNQDVLDLIEGKMGLMDLLDEACRFPSATSKDLADKLLSGPVPTASARFSRGKRSGTAFAVQHYAGPVTYQTDNMLDKNRDFVIAEHQALMAASSVPLARMLFDADGAPAAGGGALAGARKGSSGALKGSASSGNLKGFQFVSVASQFKRQLAELAAKLSELQPHYVRCIKPNPGSVALALDAPYTLEQLKCGGIMEAVRISNAGYPLRRTFGEFVDTYWPIAPDALRPRADARRAAAGKGAAAEFAADRQAVLQVLKGLGAASSEGEAPLSEGADWQIGTTMVFLRAPAAAALSRLHVRALAAAATRVQAGWRGAHARRHAAARRHAVVRLQAGTRGMLARRAARAEREHRAALALQAAWRGHAVRRRDVEVRTAARALQTAWRGRAARTLLADRKADEAMARYAPIWAAKANRAAAAMVRATAALRAAAPPAAVPSWRAALAPRAAPAPAASGKPKARRDRAAARIQSAWRPVKAATLVPPPPAAETPLHHYKEEHRAAASIIQANWRARHSLNAEARAKRLRSALVQYAARWHAAVTVQAHWRRHLAEREADAAREEVRRALFKRNAAMFEQLAKPGAGGDAAPEGLPATSFKITATSADTGGSGPDTAPKAGAPTKTWFLGGRFAAAAAEAQQRAQKGRSKLRRRSGAAGGDGSPDLAVDLPSEPATPRSLGRSSFSSYMPPTPRGSEFGDVVKCDTSLGLDKGALLAQRVGQLRERHRVTRLLSVWQHRLQQQSTQTARQRQRAQEVWERQQQMMLQHQAKQQAEQEAALAAAAAAASVVKADSVGPPLLSR
ncbi:MAG: P-loop containing nucleoside triphosphate hydrolase protein [Monoraphidium minutum]|nr:MAG: P-loop containing nucleoside triphosphate hydrolase protein [Monoraphidium minutum]